MALQYSFFDPNRGTVPLTPSLLGQIGVGTPDAAIAVTATVGTTLTAAQISAGLINRSGPTAAFTDTTDTAVNIAAANSPGGSFYFDVKNTTAFTMTLAAGAGVTISSSTIIPANSIAEYLCAVSADGSTVVMNHIFTQALTNAGPVVSTALTTVGAGTITGAGIAGGVTSRGGTQTAAFTDTTDTAAAIIAARPNVHVGDSWEYTYVNSTIWPATLAGGTGVTISTSTGVSANAWVRYLVTYTAAATITMVAIGQGHFPHLGTFVANGTSAVTVADTNLTANSVLNISLKTVGGTPAGAPYLATVTPGTGFTVKAAAGDTSTYSYVLWN